jgi:hypothetical protein
MPLGWGERLRRSPHQHRSVPGRALVPVEGPSLPEGESAIETAKARREGVGLTRWACSTTDSLGATARSYLRGSVLFIIALGL